MVNLLLSSHSTIYPSHYHHYLFIFLLLFIMDFSIVLIKLFEWLLYQILAKSCYRFAIRIRNPSLNSNPNRSSSLFPNVSKCSLEGRKSHVLVCDLFGTLLRSHSSFPYFMLVAFEGGGVLRALFLLLSFPLLLALNHELRLRVMVFITFCGLKVRNMENVARSVLPKFYLENLHLQAYEVVAATGKKVVFTAAPRVMVEWFLKDYLRVDVVLGTDLQSYGGCFTGFSKNSGFVVKHKALKEFFGDDKPDIGLGSSRSLHDHLFISFCKEAYVVGSKSSPTSVMPREKYPKPIIFHDGRLAFFPTPSATLAMFLWLPIGIILSVYRLFIGVVLPYKYSTLLGHYSGVSVNRKGKGYDPTTTTSKKGVLYVCTHRSLMDPVFLSQALAKPLTAVTYSLSKMSEFLAPIKTVRLTRDRKQDGETMERLLQEGDLVVCPEGTTCREPYLLRFSPLFAELTDDIVPVALKAHVSMFYGTTASGLKCLDPFFFLMNPRPGYDVQILDKIPKEMTCSGGKTSFEVANYIQKLLGDASGFECTNLTRKDKYLMLAGNDGIVQEKRNTKI